MTITQLEYIIALDTCKNFAEAAYQCHVTQPTLSMQVKKLEEELGVLIFDRSKKPVLTTDIGKQIIDQARISLRELNRVKEVIRDSRDEYQGDLKIGIIPTLSPYLLPLFVTQFIRKYPQVNLIVEELLSEQIAYKLNNDLLDVGILVSPLGDRSLIEIPLFYEAFAVYMSTSHPLSEKGKIDFADLDINDMWLLKEGHCFRMQTVNICSENTFTDNHRHLKFESGSLETLKRIVEKQHGYTLLPELATLDLSDGQQKHVRYFKDPQPVREVSLVIHRSFMKRKLIDLLKTEILAHIPAALKDPDRGKLVHWK
jgi:LysR family hydrogen peroxide-inducible transcriptional activator